MPKVNVFLPEVAPPEFRESQPVWVSREVRAGLALDLGGLGGADWTESFVRLALGAVGRVEPLINDIVTLYGETAGGVSVADTRTWNGEKWVRVEDFFDGNLVVPGTLLAKSLAANIITGGPGGHVKTRGLTTREATVNIVNGQTLKANTIRSREIDNSRAFFTNSLQIGPGRITLINLSDDIRPAAATSIRRVLTESTNWQRLQQNSVASFRRDTSEELISMQGGFYVEVTTPPNVGAYVELDLYLRARLGTTATDFAASTIIPSWMWHGRIRVAVTEVNRRDVYRVANVRYRAGIHDLSGRSVYSDVTGRWYYIPPGESLVIPTRVFHYILHTGVPKSFFGDVAITGDDTIEIALAQSPLNTDRHIYLEGYYTATEYQGVRDSDGSNRNSFFNLPFQHSVSAVFSRFEEPTVQ